VSSSTPVARTPVARTAVKRAAVKRVTGTPVPRCRHRHPAKSIRH
jgi:hypothetical protein